MKMLRLFFVLLLAALVVPVVIPVGHAGAEEYTEDYYFYPTGAHWSGQDSYHWKDPTDWTTHWSLVDDPYNSPDDGTTRIYASLSSGQVGSAEFYLSDTTGSMTGTITGVYLVIRSKVGSSSNVRGGLHLDEQNKWVWGGYTGQSADYNTTTLDFTTNKPGGGSWCWDDIDELVIDLNGYNKPYVTQTYIHVTADYGDSPVGATLDAGNISSSGAELRGKVLYDGGDPCQFRFKYQVYGTYYYTDWSGFDYETGNETATQVEFTSSTPVTYRVEVVNTHDDSFGGWLSFTTLSESAPHLPVIQSDRVRVYWNTVADEWVLESFNTLTDDGNLDTVAGFQIREDGTEEWFELWGLGSCTGQTCGTCSNIIYHTGDKVNVNNWCSELDILEFHTYEVRAMAQNLLGFGYGAILHTAEVPADGTGDVDDDDDDGFNPWDWSNIFPDMGGLGKGVLGVILTILGTVMVGSFLGGKGGSIPLIITAGGLVTIFTMIDWFPDWIIILIAVGLGLAFFVKITSGGK